MVERKYGQKSKYTDKGIIEEVRVKRSQDFTFNH